MPFRQVAAPRFVPGQTFTIVGADPRHSTGTLLYLRLVRSNGEVIFVAVNIVVQYAYVQVQEAQEQR